MPTITKKGETKYRCTACSSHIKNAFGAFLHPLLKVLICRKCHTDYGTGDFSQFNDPDVGPGVDENGDDNYCRWCVDGGDLYACANGDLEGPERCHYAFCTDCIKRNCPDEEVLNQENFSPDSDYRWNCFACKPEKLKKLRQEAQEIMLALSGTDLKRPNNINASLRDSPVVTINGTKTNITGLEKQTEEADSAKERLARQREKEIERIKERDRAEREREAAAKEKEKEAAAKEKEKEAAAKEKEKEANNGKEQVARDKDQQAFKEKDQRVAKEKEPPVSKEREQQAAKEKEQQAPKEKASDKRDKDRDRDSSATGIEEGQATKKRKTDGISPSGGDAIAKEPEATSMPPVAPPKPPESALRRLSKKSVTPEGPKIMFTKSNFPNSTSGISSTLSASPKTYGNIQSTLPRSVNNINKARFPQSGGSQIQESNKANGAGMKSRPLSKQLKASNEQIKPSCKVPLSEIELKKRLENFELVKQNCIKEMGVKFQNVFEMFLSKDLGQGKTILKFEIEDLEKPIQEFTTMLRDLKSLYHSQT